MVDVIDPRDNRIVAVWRPGIDGPAKPIVYDRKTNRELDHNKVVDTLPSEANVHTLTVDPKSHAVFVYRNESNKVDGSATKRVSELSPELGAKESGVGLDPPAAEPNIEW